MHGDQHIEPSRDRDYGRKMGQGTLARVIGNNCPDRGTGIPGRDCHGAGRPQPPFPSARLSTLRPRRQLPRGLFSEPKTPSAGGQLELRAPLDGGLTHLGGSDAGCERSAPHTTRFLEGVVQASRRRRVRSARQCQSRNGRDAADVSRRLCAAALHRPGRRFFEWHATHEGKRPYAVAMQDGSPFGIGGL